MSSLKFALVLSEIFKQSLSCLLRVVKSVNPLSANLTKWPNTLKQFVSKLSTNCSSVFGHFLNLALKGLSTDSTLLYINRIMIHISSCVLWRMSLEIDTSLVKPMTSFGHNMMHLYPIRIISTTWYG